MSRLLPLLLLLFLCPACTVWHDRAVLELRVRGTEAERQAAQRRVLAGLPMVPPGDQERHPEPDGGWLLITGGDSVHTVEREFAAVRATLLAPPAGPHWRLLVRVRQSSLVNTRWQEWSEAGPEPAPTSRVSDPE